MQDGTSRFSHAGTEIKHFAGVSSFSNFTVIPEGAVLKIPRDLPLELAALLDEPSLVDLSSRASVWVVGDLHGSLECLFTALRTCDSYPRLLEDGTCTIVFNGDFVDRGEKSVEVALTIFAWQQLCPEVVFLNRGNHEERLRRVAGGA